jgi:poly-gamma-glutamate synthesis protein (capsule biosynthesis protein)
MGQPGLTQTYDYLTNANIQYFGNPGAPIHHRYIIKTIKGLNLGFVNYNQFTPNGLQTALDDLQTIKPLSDLVIVIAHWGNEYQTTANQTIQALAHSFIDLGADLVIGSHPHVVQQQEVYKNKTIYYSLGNFVYDQYFSSETSTGLLVETDINPQTKSIFFTNYKLQHLLTGQTIFKQD